MTRTHLAATLATGLVLALGAACIVLLLWASAANLIAVLQGGGSPGQWLLAFGCPVVALGDFRLLVWFYQTGRWA